MHKNTTFYNSISAIIMQSVIMFAGLILPRQYLLAYGSEINGLVSSITQFLSYFSLVEAGLASAVVASLYLPISQKNLPKVSEIISAAKKFYLQIGFLFSGLAVSFAFIYPLLVTSAKIENLEMSILVLVIAANTIIDFLTLARYRVLLTADNRYYVVANSTTISCIISTILVIISIRLGGNIIVARIIAISQYAIRSVIINLYIRKQYTDIDRKAKPDVLSVSKRWDALLLQLLGLVQNALPVVMLTILRGDLLIVSLYSIYNMIAAAMINILGSITNGVVARLGQSYASENYYDLQNAYAKYEFLFLLLTSWIYSCMNCLYQPFISIYTRGIEDMSYNNYLVGLLFTLNGFLYNLKTPSGTLIGAAGVFRETKKATIIQTSIAVVGMVCLVPHFGVVGVLTALIFSNLYRVIDLPVFMSANVLKNSVRTTFYRYITSFLAFTIASIPSLVTVEIGSYFQWAAYATIIAVWSCMVIFIIQYIFDRNSLKQVVGHFTCIWN